MLLPLVLLRHSALRRVRMDARSRARACSVTSFRATNAVPARGPRTVKRTMEFIASLMGNGNATRDNRDSSWDVEPMMTKRLERCARADSYWRFARLTA